MRSQIEPDNLRVSGDKNRVQIQQRRFKNRLLPGPYLGSIRHFKQEIIFETLSLKNYPFSGKFLKRNYQFFFRFHHLTSFFNMFTLNMNRAMLVHMCILSFPYMLMIRQQRSLAEFSLLHKNNHANRHSTSYEMEKYKLLLQNYQIHLKQKYRQLPYYYN